MNHHGRRRIKSRVTRTIIVVAVAAAIPTGSAMALFCGFDGVILDPTNLAENVLQATALGKQVARATTQIALQIQALADLPVSVAGELASANNAVHQHVPAVGPAIDAAYPIIHADAAPGWLETARHEWTRSERSSLAAERAFNDHVQRSMSPTTDRLAALISASNGVDLAVDERPGPKAVLQAHEELLAVYSGEVDKLIGLRAWSARRKITAHARRQATEAYQRARREALMSDWDGDNTHSVPAIRNTFGQR